MSKGSRAAAIVALLLLIPAPTIGVFLAMVPDATRGLTWGAAAYVACKVWILVFPALWLLLVERGRLSLSPVRQGGLKVGALLGVLTSAAIVGAYFVFHTWIDVDSMREAVERNGIGTPIRYLALVIPLALLNSLIEEYVWRWFVFRKCETLMGGGLAVVVSALLFTVHHIVALKAQTSWDVTLLASLGVFLGGCAWSWMYRRYRSIWPGYISHIIADIAVFGVGWMILFK
jgi:uncharacterized protein